MIVFAEFFVNGVSTGYYWLDHSLEEHRKCLGHRCAIAFAEGNAVYTASVKNRGDFPDNRPMARKNTVKSTEPDWVRFNRDNPDHGSYNFQEFKILDLGGETAACASFLYKGYEVSMSTLMYIPSKVCVFRGNLECVAVNTVAEAIEWINNQS